MEKKIMINCKLNLSETKVRERQWKREIVKLRVIIEFLKVMTDKRI